MCESLERKDAARPELPYDLEEPTDEREITRALMKLSAQTLAKYVGDEPDIYYERKYSRRSFPVYGPKFCQTQARPYSSRDKI